MEVIAFSRGLLALEFHGGDRFFPWIVVGARTLGESAIPFVLEEGGG